MQPLVFTYLFVSLATQAQPQTHYPQPSPSSSLCHFMLCTFLYFSVSIYPPSSSQLSPTRRTIILVLGVRHHQLGMSSLSHYCSPQTLFTNVVLFTAETQPVERSHYTGKTHSIASFHKSLPSPLVLLHNQQLLYNHDPCMFYICILPPTRNICHPINTPCTKCMLTSSNAT